MGCLAAISERRHISTRIWVKIVMRARTLLDSVAQGDTWRPPLRLASIYYSTPWVFTLAIDGNHSGTHSNAALIDVDVVNLSPLEAH
jgi:hypothetical protein